MILMRRLGRPIETLGVAYSFVLDAGHFVRSGTCSFMRAAGVAAYILSDAMEGE